ncbi:MAG: hypothetical protein FJ288_07770 [Planctomycetes bacterium]|nr:hypothetical protein [Planctomycetota bacterium]
MNMSVLAAGADAQARVEGWTWWLALVACLVVVLLALAVLRRLFLKPMPHKPTDTSDAWAEAGRRLAVPPPDDGRKGADSEGEGRS